MQRKFFLSPWFLIPSGVVLFFLIFLVGVCVWFYNSVFRLSLPQIKQDLPKQESSCKTIDTCALLPGDILIRKYMTQRIQYIDRPLHIFFTHTAFYLGDGKLFEVFGPEKNPNDDIQTLELSKSDWLNSDITNFVIIRPKNYGQNLDIIKRELESIARDPSYRFGLSFLEPKHATCADVVFYELYKNEVIHAEDIPRVVTPDYLFWLATHNSNEFQIVGFRVQ